VKRSFFGVVSAKPPTAQDYSRMGSARVGTLRLIFNWQSIQPSGPGAYDWSGYDSQIGQAARQGIRVFPTIYGSPGWAAAEPNNPPTPDYYDEFLAFCRAAANRYGAGGTFWAEHTPAVPITHWQVWNEPNLRMFWNSHPDPWLYKELLVQAHAGIKGGDPNARVVLAGLPTSDADAYLAGIYRAGGARYFDAAAIHPYSATPALAIGVVASARRVMTRFHDRSPIWITEMGWASHGPGGGGLSTVGMKGQAYYLTQFFRWTTRPKARRRLGLAGIIWYSLRDSLDPGTPASSSFPWTGLFHRSGAPKPAWRAFMKVTKGKKAKT
jgi:hypothetical protein